MHPILVTCDTLAPMCTLPARLVTYAPQSCCAWPEGPVPVDAATVPMRYHEVVLSTPLARFHCCRLHSPGTTGPTCCDTRSSAGLAVAPTAR